MWGLVFGLALAQSTPDSGITVRWEDIADGRSADLDKDFIQAYESKYGFTVTVGDTLTVGQPTGGAMRYMGGAGAGSATSASRGYFQYVYNGTMKASMAKMVAAGLGGNYDPLIYSAPASVAGSEMKILAMKLGGTRAKPVIWAECELVNSREKANFTGILTIADFDQAIGKGEAIDARYITRDVAVQKIKEAKELLDIGVYTQEQFDTVKAKYLPYIVEP